MLSVAEENELLREQNRQLRDLVFRKADAEPYHRLGIRGMKAKLLAILMRHEVVSRDLAMEALYSHKADQPDPKVIEVMLCKLRKLLLPHSIKISVTYSVGWSISPEDKKHLLDVI